MKKALFIILLFLTTNTFAQTATVDKNQITLNEAFLLTISLDKRPTSKPDFSVLQNDFQIINTTNAFKTEAVNGFVKQNIEYILTLMPLKEGKLTIPAISVNGTKTKPITIDVTKDAMVASINRPNVEFAGVLEKQSAYVQEEINYSLVLTDDGGLEISEPLFGDTNDFVIKSLGKPTVANTIKDGKKQRTITFNYALFPQTSGNLTIPAAEIQGYAIQEINLRDPFANTMFSGFGFNTQKKPVAFRVAQQAITIKPAPQDWAGKWWVPAQSLSLSDAFMTTQYTQGEPIKRIITIEAKGIMDTQLPEINFPQANNLKQYPQKAQSQNFVKEGEVLSVKEATHTYIPQTSGEVVLPAINVDWFDVVSNQTKTATIEAQTIYVAASTTFVANNEPEQTTTKPQETKTEKTIAPQAPNKSSNIFLLASALLIGVVIGYLFSRPKKINLKKQVLNSKNPKELEKNLVLWAQSKYDNVYNIKDIANKVMDKDFSQITESLSQNLYGSNNDFDLKIFFKHFLRIAEKKPVAEDAVLPKLYK